MVPTAFNVILYEPITYPKSVKHKTNKQMAYTHELNNRLKISG